MVSVEVRGSGGGIDPSNLHLKKELTQIRKAARVLKDPGTSSSSWLGTARSLTKHHYMHHRSHGNNAAAASSSSADRFLQLPLQDQSCGNVARDKEKERKVFLYNWRSQKSESEASRPIGEDDAEGGKEQGSSSTLEDSVDMDSLTGVGNGGANDSKSDTYLSDVYSSSMFRIKGMSFTPSVRRTIRKKPKRKYYSSKGSRYYKEQLRMQGLLSRYTKNVVADELLSYVDQSDDTGDCFDPEDLTRTSALSPLLARIKNKGWVLSPAKLLRSHRKDDASVAYSTPALSTSSYNRYAFRNPSTVGSWDATTGSINDDDNDMDDQLDMSGQQGCGIPCYWSKRSTPKSRHGSSCSPSISDTLRRKGSIIFCGSQAAYQRRPYRSSFSSNKKRFSSKAAAQSLVPLLTNTAHGEGGSSVGSGDSNDELTTNFEELDLEALSRLDGRRWSSSCRSQEGLELVALSGEVHEDGSPENMRSLSHKYRPMFFEELIGQNILVQSLTNAISRKRIAPVYLFQGPRGTGKTSAARIFAAALNCLAAEGGKPCGICRECANFISGKNSNLGEVDGSNKKGTDKIKHFLKNIPVINPSTISQYKVFIVEECHLLPSKTWLAFLRLLEKPLPRVVFVLITTDIDNVPRAILSRCQKHLFNKISNADIVDRLRKISTEENFDVELNALELIASNANGSLRDAETMLDQLSLFGKRITKSLVNELIGVVSDEKLLDLLELAMSSNAPRTVIKARELMDSGVDPILIMSQMVNLIVDIIAGTYPSFEAKQNDSFFGGRSLSDRELERLKHALTILSQAEKHMGVSSERSAWFTATLLQLGSLPSSPGQTHSTSSRRQSYKATEAEKEVVNTQREALYQKHRTDSQLGPETAGSPLTSFGAVNHNFNGREDPISPTHAVCTDDKMLSDIWLQCIDKCHSKTLRQLLHSYGKLISVSETNGSFVVHVAFDDSNIKTRAEGFLSSITNSFEIVLRCTVDVNLVVLQDSSGQKQKDNKYPMNLETKSMRINIAGDTSDLDTQPDQLMISGRSFNVSEGHHQTQSLESVAGFTQMSAPKEGKSDIPLRRIESIIHEQRLETAWLQAMEKATPGSVNHLKPERNQVLPQDAMDNSNGLESITSLDVPPPHWEDELNHEIKAININDGMGQQKDEIAKRINHCPISPSLLHSSSLASNFTKDNMGYESGSGAGGCSGMFCWKNTKPKRRVKARQGAPICPHKSGHFSWFGECARSRTDNRCNP